MTIDEPAQPSANGDGRRQRPDLRLVAPAGSAWLVSALSVGRAPQGPVTAAALAFGLAVVVGVAARRARLATRGVTASRLTSAIAVLVLVAGTAAVCAVRTRALHAEPVRSLAHAGAPVTADVVISGDPRRVGKSSGRPPLLVVSARLTSLGSGGVEHAAAQPITILASGRGWDALLPGQRAHVRGRLTDARPRDPTAATLLARGSPALVGRPGLVQRVAGEMRFGLRAAVAHLPDGERGLLPGVVVGDTSGLSDDLEADFKATGLTHLTAVSGANCAVVLATALFAGRWLGLRGRALPLLGALALLGFLVLARPQPSVLRATVMGWVAVAAIGSGRRRVGVPAVCAAVVALLLWDPWLALSYGFALSVVATAGLLLLAQPWTEALSAVMPRPFAALVAVPSAAQAVCGPILVLLAPQVSLASVPANLLVAPAVPPATVLGVLTAVTAPVNETVARAVASLAALPTWWIVTVATHAARWPGATVPWPGGVRGAVGLAVATVALVLATRASLGPRASIDEGRRAPGPLIGRLRRARLTRLAALAVAASVTAVVWLLRTTPWPPPGWTMVVCDVGQGDAVVLSAGPGSAVVVDAGPEPAPVRRCLDDLGVRQVPALVLTHFHADHVGGLDGVLRGRSVGEVVVGPLDDPPEQAREVRRTLRSRGIFPRLAKLGERDAVGALRWQVLAPERAYREGSPPNNTSIVLLVESAGLRLLLTGDVEPAAQRALLRELDRDADGRLDAGPVDVLKVAHHGSANQLPEFLRLTAGRVNVVSVGADNDYGHPAPLTLRTLSAQGGAVARTDRDGDVAIVGPAAHLRIVRRGR